MAVIAGLLQQRLVDTFHQATNIQPYNMYSGHLYVINSLIYLRPLISKVNVTGFDNANILDLLAVWEH